MSGVPNSILAYPTGGVDGVGAILSPIQNYTSPYLLSGLFSPDVNMATEKRGEQFSSVVANLPGTRILGQNQLPVVGFEHSTITRVSSTPVRIASTANIGSSNTQVYSTDYLRGYQGDVFGGNNSLLAPSERLYNNLVLQDIKNHIHKLSRDTDRQLFQSMWSLNYVDKSSASGAAMTSSSETFTSHVTHAPIAWTIDLLAAGSQQDKGVAVGNFLKQIPFVTDANGYSLSMSDSIIRFIMPDFIASAIDTSLSQIHPGMSRFNSGTSDGSLDSINAKFSSYSEMQIIRAPHKDFYTVAADANKSYICLALVPEAVKWYVPKQNGNLIGMLRGFDAMPGFSHVGGMDQNMLWESLINNFAIGPNPALTEQDFMEASSRFSDPILGLLQKGIAARYPDPYGAGYRGSYHPLCYGMYTYKMGPSTTAVTSYGTSFEVNMFAGTLRSQAYYIVPIHINPKLIVAAPPVYENPYTSTYNAASTMGTAQFAKFAYEQPELVNSQLKSEEPITFNGETMTIMQYVDTVQGRDWRSAAPVQIRHNLLDLENSSAKQARRVPRKAQEEALKAESREAQVGSLGKILEGVA